MDSYKRLLLVVDLSEDSLTIGRRAVALARSCGARIDLLHVVEFVPVEPMGETLMPAVQIEEELLERAQAAPAPTSPRNSASPRRNCSSRPATSRRRSCAIARERGTDLIVIGSRERHGLSILVNLTEDTVLHASPCDVLAVRVGGPAR